MGSGDLSLFGFFAFLAMVFRFVLFFIPPYALALGGLFLATKDVV